MDLLAYCIGVMFLLALAWAYCTWRSDEKRQQENERAVRAARVKKLQAALDDSFIEKVSGVQPTTYTSESNLYSND